MLIVNQFYHKDLRVEVLRDLPDPLSQVLVEMNLSVFTCVTRQKEPRNSTIDRDMSARLPVATQSIT
eukprot:3379541-Amphidinium_carterae.1